MRVSLFWVNNLRKRKLCNEHAHPFWEIVFLDGSDGYVRAAGKRHPYKAGDIAVHPPGHRHAVHNDSPGAHYCLGMEGDEFRNLTFMIIRTTPDLRGAFRNLADELSQRDRYHPMVIDALAAWIVWILLRTAGRDGKKDETGPASRVATAKEMIDREFDRPRLTLDEISQRVLLKKDSLRHLFKKRYGTSPIQYLIAKKIGRAKFLLAGSGEKIYRIAMETGFENEYYFSRIFKKATGLTPTQYRRRCRV